MGVRRSKNRNVLPVALTLDKGVNYGRTGEAMGDNELQAARNVIYDPNTMRLTTRPGTACVLSEAGKMTSSIRAIYHYVKDSSTAYLVCASGSTLYYLSGNTLTEIGSLASSSVMPSFLTFNGKLLIADGSAAIRTWDGSTYTTIAGSPQADCLSMIKNRVVANAVNEPDSVYLSAPNDETDWNTAGSAVGLRAGFGDGLKVNGFAVLGDDLFISKVGRSTTSAKKIYRLNVAALTTTSWYCEHFSSNNAFVAHQCAVSAFNNVYFADTNGFKTVKGIQEYGDLAVLPAGTKVNSILENAVCTQMAFTASYDAIWFLVSNRIYCYTAFNDAFTDMDFTWGAVTAVCDANGIVYLGGDNGYLYKLDEDRYRDEVTPNTHEYYESYVVTKAFSAGEEILLKRLRALFRPKAASTINVWGVLSDESATLLGSASMGSEGSYLYDATGYLYDATDHLGDTAAPEFKHWYSSMRAESIALKLQALSGRFIIESLRAEFATVG